MQVTMLLDKDYCDLRPVESLIAINQNAGKKQVAARLRSYRDCTGDNETQLTEQSLLNAIKAHKVDKSEAKHMDNLSCRCRRQHSADWQSHRQPCGFLRWRTYTCHSTDPGRFAEAHEGQIAGGVGSPALDRRDYPADWQSHRWQCEFAHR